jgi:signal transduction histidine kinase
MAEAVLRADASADDFYSRIAASVCELAPMQTAVVLRHDDVSGRLSALGAHGPEAHDAARAGWWPTAVSIRRALADGGVRELTAGGLEDAVAVCTPMVAAGHAVGAIVSTRAPGSDRTTVEDRALLSLIGRTAALVALARVATARRDELRWASERVALTRELHDRVIQRLFGVSLALGATGDVEEATRQRCVDEVGGALVDLRAVLARPTRDAAPRPGAATLRRFAAELAERHPQLALTLDWPDDVAVPSALDAVLQSILRELVGNVARHAAPTRTDVRLALVDATLELSVINDGAAPRRGRPGAGLRLAAFDALCAGGALALGPHGAGEWRVRVLVPAGEDG